MLFNFFFSCNKISQSIVCDFQRGWIKHVVGGLGGKIIKVTNLNATGKGSLYAAIKAKGARVIVFEVSGTIDLKGKNLDIKSPFLTIAGRTSPSPGITLINGGIKIKTHDIVIQHLHVRPGALGKSKGWEPDGFSVHAGHNIIIDYNCISWAVDENLSVSGPRFGGNYPTEWRANISYNVTFSNNVIAQAA